MQARGFTLLEIMVALAVMALGMALVAPASFRMIASWQEASDVSRVLNHIAALPIQVRQRGRTLLFDQQTPAEEVRQLLGLPEDWTMEFDKALIVHANGACEGTQATLVTSRQSIPIHIDTPFCQPRRE